MHSEFIHTSNVHTCSVCTEHPSSAQAWIVHHFLFVFGSVETTQKDACCVQMFNDGTEQCAYTEFKCASNMQICIVCRDDPAFKRPSFAFEYCWAQGQRYGQDKIEQRNQELDWDMHISCMRIQSLPRARVIPVVPNFGCPKLPRHRRRRTGIWKDEGMPRGQCSHGLRARITHTCRWPARSVWWYFVSMSEITCIHGLFAGDLWDLNEYMLCSSQTACVRLVIAHVHTQSDAHQTICGLPELWELLPTSCMQVLSPTFIIHLRQRDGKVYYKTTTNKGKRWLW